MDFANFSKGLRNVVDRSPFVEMDRDRILARVHLRKQSGNGGRRGEEGKSRKGGWGKGSRIRGGGVVT